MTLKTSECYPVKLASWNSNPPNWLCRESRTSRLLAHLSLAQGPRNHTPEFPLAQARRQPVSDRSQLILQENIVGSCNNWRGLNCGQRFSRLVFPLGCSSASEIVAAHDRSGNSCFFRPVVSLRRSPADARDCRS